MQINGSIDWISIVERINPKTRKIWIHFFDFHTIQELNRINNIYDLKEIILDIEFTSKKPIFNIKEETERQDGIQLLPFLLDLDN